MTQMIERVLDWARGVSRVTVHENERALLLIEGKLDSVLGPGRHIVPARRDYAVERHNLARPEFVSDFARALLRDYPALAAEHLTVVQAGENEVAVAFRDGTLHTISMSPQQRAILWTAAGPWEIKCFPLTETLAVPETLRAALETGVGRDAIVKASIEAGHVGLLTVGGVFKEVLPPGQHLFWKTGRPVAARVIDMRERIYDVTGQEVLTADSVTIRVNVSAEMRVVDPVKATMESKDYIEALHLALQLAFRKTVGQRTLDQLLKERVTVDAEAAETVRAAMSEIGVEIGEITLKDIVLPGEMRSILNRVVEAEKVAEANVIKRREETSATRALLNTAKVMEENPVMLRLKELEVLTELACTVESLTVHNGTEGLLNDLVKLRA